MIFFNLDIVIELYVVKKFSVNALLCCLH